MLDAELEALQGENSEVVCDTNRLAQALQV